jgi:hypothetical protein
VRLYARLFMELGGGYGRQLKEELGPVSVDIYKALEERANAQLDAIPAAEPVLDPIDWAALRALVPAILRHFRAGEFQTVTGGDLAEVEELGRRAEQEIREFHWRGGFISFQRGTCLVRLPWTMVGRGIHLFGVPDVASWTRVMPECARGQRDAYLTTIKGRLSPLREGTERRWEERNVGSFEELEAWVREQRADYLRRRAERRSQDAGPS